MMPLMVWRRHIRGSVVLMLVVCIGAWAASYWALWDVEYQWKQTTFGLLINCGRVGFLCSDDSLFPTRDGWYATRTAVHDWAAADEAAEIQFHGFAFVRNRGVLVPLWFLTTVSAGLMFVVWRTPRGGGGGFPISVASSGPVAGGEGGAGAPEA